MLWTFYLNFSASPKNSMNARNSRHCCFSSLSCSTVLLVLVCVSCLASCWDFKVRTRCNVCDRAWGIEFTLNRLSRIEKKNIRFPICVYRHQSSSFLVESKCFSEVRVCVSKAFATFLFMFVLLSCFGIATDLNCFWVFDFYLQSPTYAQNLCFHAH